jgi:hypothetical protein
MQPCDSQNIQQFQIVENCGEPCPPPSQCSQKQPNFEFRCAPQYFQQPEQACLAPNDQYDSCTPCFDPCETSEPCLMPLEVNCQPQPCPTIEPCNPMCSPYRRCRYVQPPRRQSFKPTIRYQPPTIPMTEDTVYKRSFEVIDSQTAANCRLPPVRPVAQIGVACGDFARDTVTGVSPKVFHEESCSNFDQFQLSYQPAGCYEKAKPIYPFSRSLLGTGPMQSLTTQKHDFVSKFQYKQQPFKPQHNIMRSCGGVENATIQRLSFMAPKNVSRVKSLKPIITYQPPEREKLRDSFMNCRFDSPISFSSNGVRNNSKAQFHACLSTTKGRSSLGSQGKILPTIHPIRQGHHQQAFISTTWLLRRRLWILLRGETRQHATGCVLICRFYLSLNKEK